MYTFLSRLQAEVSNTIIIGTISISYQPAYDLFDLGFTYSYVYAMHLDMLCEPLPLPMCIATLGNSLLVDRVHQSCVLSILGNNNRKDLIILDMVYFDFILGMDWLR